MTTNYRDRTYSMFNNLLITIMQFTYKYISSTIILLFACTSFLAVISHNEHIWYVYIGTVVKRIKLYNELIANVI